MQMNWKNLLQDINNAGWTIERIADAIDSSYTTTQRMMNKDQRVEWQLGQRIIDLHKKVCDSTDEPA